ncbi:hypothetical protein GGQ77_002929 [Geobacillus thermodenitrificans]|jgi:hypothetical protein|nr:hypothetical protein GEPA3_0429 [Geobacillus sp. PA-3]MEC5189140.1 hypothetical protein [Geobacillus thermodenitrificans]MED0664298.1 hypothetical protein [Geobacillus thermodenitrificans]
MKPFLNILFYIRGLIQLVDILDGNVSENTLHDFSLGDRQNHYFLREKRFKRENTKNVVLYTCPLKIEPLGNFIK